MAKEKTLLEYSYLLGAKDEAYRGYSFKPKMNGGSMMDTNRFRSLRILKDYFGIDGKGPGIKLLGEYNCLDILPLPDTKSILK